MKHYGPVLIVFAAVLWAVDGILRRSLFSLPPITIVFYEHLIGLLILAPFLIRSLRGSSLSRREWGVTILISLLSGVLGTLFFTTALLKTNFIDFSVVFLLQKLQPVFAVILAVLLLKERVSLRYGLWALLALVAAYFVTFPRGVVVLAPGGENLIAALFALGAAITWGASTALSRYMLQRQPVTLITGLRFFFTTIIAFFFVISMSEVASLSVVTGSQLLRFLVIALSTGMVALWFYYQGLRRTEAKVATILELTFPLLAVFIDIFLYDTVLDVTQYLAAAVLVYAMYRVSRIRSVY